MLSLSRGAVRETADGLGIRAPADLDLPEVQYVTLALVLWVVVEYFLVSGVTAGVAPAPLYGFLLVLWTAAGLAGIGVAAWGVYAPERLFVTSGALVLSKGRLFRRGTDIYQLDEVKNLRIRTVFVTRTRGKVQQTVAVNTIAFDARGRTHDFGAQMDVEERSAAYAALLRHLPPGAGAAEEPEQE